MIKTKGITLTSYDYKDNDKHIVIFTADRGKIVVTAKGIKKAQAKLKFCGQPFCFGEFELQETRGRYTLTGCSLVENFGELTTDIDKYYSGCVIVDSVATLCLEGQSNPKVLVEVLQALQCLSTQDVNALMVVVVFLLNLMRAEGNTLNINRCSSCGCAMTSGVIDSANGSVYCDQCGNNDIVINNRVMSVLKLLDNCNYVKLSNMSVSLSNLKETIQLLDRYTASCYAKIKTLSQLVRL